MKFLILPCSFCLLFLSCKKQPVVTAEPFTENLYGGVYERVIGLNRHLIIGFGTVKQFECAGYEIVHTFSQNGNNLSFNFIKIIHPQEYCIDVVMPAGAEIGLGSIANNTYNLSFNFGDTIVNGSLSVSDNGFIVALPNQNRINFPSPDIKKIPPHTIFGDIELSGGMEAAAEQYIDSLQAAGVATTNYLPGDYVKFEIGSNGQVVPTGQNFFRNYVFSFDGDTSLLHGIHARFRAAYPSGLAINLNTRYY